ncbi:MAG: RkpR, polysaccharide export protein [Rhizobiaceae bacterium]|nr:MAG: RkpR, polysaccharide export protein [Rhizobiaceae bacterium]
MDNAQQKIAGASDNRIEPELRQPRPVPKNLVLLQGLLERPFKAPATPVPPPEPEVVAPEPSSDVVSTSAAVGKTRLLKTRHFVIGASFVLAVAVPTALSSLYMAFVAADQYHSSSSFSVRSIESAQASDLMGIFGQASSGSTISDSYVLLDFILSERMVQAIDEAFGIDKIFAPRGSDFFYGISKDAPIEDKLDYWRNMISVNLDHTSGIMNLQVKAFSAEDSQQIADFVITQSEKLVNELSLYGRTEVLKVAQEEVSTAENRLAGAREALRDYRDSSQEADPVEGAKLAAQLIGSLEQQLVQLRTDLSTALTQLSENTPRVRVLRSQITSLESQLNRERQRFGSGTAAGKQGRSATGSDVAGRIQKYETLQTSSEFAERAYTSSLASLEKARLDANAKQRYLAVFIRPSLSEMAQYPSRVLNSFLVLIGSLLLWGVVVMGYYNIRDRN